VKLNTGYKAVTVYQAGQLMGGAYSRSATLEIAVNAFRKCGIHPYDASIFDDHEFIPQHEHVNIEGELPVLPPVDKPIPVDSIARPTTRDRCKHVSSFNLRPSPTWPATSSTGRKGGQAALVTSSPFKKSLEGRRPKSSSTSKSKPNINLVGASSSKRNQVDCSAPKKQMKESRGKQSAQKQIICF
jgi:hypothetical protein